MRKRWKRKVFCHLGPFNNSPLPSYLVLLFYNESSCKTFLRENEFDLHENNP